LFGFDCLGSVAVSQKRGSLDSFVDTKDHTSSQRDSCLVKEQNGEVSTSLAFSTIGNRYEEHS